MPRANVAVTASVRSRVLDRSILLLIILAIFFGLITLKQSAKGNVILLGNKEYITEVVRTKEQQELGLGKRVSLSKDHAMLFVFEKNGQPCFWMKDMKFPLDIIWLDNTKRIVHIEQNVPPYSYPGSFCPNSDSNYVLEINANEARRLDLHNGSLASFNL